MIAFMSTIPSFPTKLSSFALEKSLIEFRYCISGLKAMLLFYKELLSICERYWLPSGYCPGKIIFQTFSRLESCVLEIWTLRFSLLVDMLVSYRVLLNCFILFMHSSTHFSHLL